MSSFSPEEIAILKQRVCDQIDEVAPMLIDVSQQIWENPEIAFEEHKASSWLSDILRRSGYTVENGVGGLDTAFTAKYVGKTTGPTIGLFSEYDALIGLGHGCGHNLLAISGVGAGVGLAAIADELPGTIQIHGTPAEEGPSGKTLLMKKGVFDDLDAALIFHPADNANVLAKMRTGQGIWFKFTGKPAHAAGHPDLAIDALTGVIAVFNNINLLRQHFKPDASVTGSIPDGGGTRSFPVEATARIVVRVFEGETDFTELREKIVNCARAAALSTGTTLEITYGNLERGMKFNTVVADLVTKNAERVGVDLTPRVTIGGMSDFGNVSHMVPSAHISTPTWPAGVTPHTPEAVVASNSTQGYEAALDAAKIEAMATIDLLTQPDLLESARRDFEANDMGQLVADPDAA